MEEKKLENIENNQVEKNKGLEYEFSAQTFILLEKIIIIRYFLTIKRSYDIIIS